MNRRGFLAGVAAALGVAKAGVLGAEEVPEVGNVVANPVAWPYSVRWYSANESLATVTQDGVVTFLGPGPVEIFCTCEGLTSSMVLDGR